MKWTMPAARRLSVAALMIAVLLPQTPAPAGPRPDRSRSSEPASARRTEPGRPGLRLLQEALEDRHEMDPRHLGTGPAPAWLVPRGDDRDAPPSNDAFSSATLISYFPTFRAATTREATTEPGEPVPSCASVSAAGTSVPLSGATAWFRFTAQATGRLLVRAIGGVEENTVLAVHRGAALGALTEVACNDNDGTALSSRSYLEVTKGQTYHVQLGAVLSQATDVTLSIQEANQGVISGTVRNQAGTPLEGICVLASEEGEGFGGSDRTDASGTYRLESLAGGSYRLWFTDCESPTEYLSEWYRDASSYDDATPIAVGTAEVAGIDAVLSTGASISGRVTDEAGQPLAEICVSTETDQDYSYAPTDASGVYRLGALRGGSYRILFSDCGEDEVFIREWYDDRPSYAEADPLEVAPDQGVTGIDASLERGASISGVVTDEDGAPIEWACLDARDERGAYSGSSYSDADGRFRIGALKGGPHRLEAMDCDEQGFLTEWYLDEPDLASADPISVAAHADLEGIEIRLGRGASISGTVTAEGLGPYGGACVDAYRADGSWAGDDGYADGNGAYSLDGLRGGSYRLQFYDCGGSSHAYTWSGDAPDFDSAAVVVVPDGGAVTGVDAQLPIGGSISGSITGPDGEELSMVCVGAVDASGWWIGGAWQNYSAYQISGLHAGSVYVEQTDCWSSLAPEWYPDATHRLAGEPVPVVAAQETPGIDAELGPAGWIEGSVVDTNGQPAVWLCADLYDAAEYLAGWGGTEEEGVLALGPLPAGEHRISFYDCDMALYEDEWYEGAEDYAHATPVAVTAGATTEIQATIRLRTEAPKSLEVRLAGGGRVTSDPDGIDCSATCQTTFVTDAVVTLAAEAAPGYAFLGWKGAGCSGTGACSVVMSDHRAVRALFSPE